MPGAEGEGETPPSTIPDVMSLEAVPAEQPATSSPASVTTAARLNPVRDAMETSVPGSVLVPGAGCIIHEPFQRGLAPA
jgi:hypothetical protein